MPIEAPSTVRCGDVVLRLARTREKVLVTFELSAAQYRVLSFLKSSPANAGALADRPAVARPSLTALVDGLVARGYVERSNDPVDRRRVAHMLTPEGRRVIEAADAAIAVRLGEILEFAQPEHAQQASDGLAAWREPLDRARVAESTEKGRREHVERIALVSGRG